MTTDFAPLFEAVTRTDVSEDELLEALTHEDRRRAISHLADRTDEWVAVDELATSLPADDDQAMLRLYHHHVPKLADLGVVEYDSDRGAVSLADDLSEAVPSTVTSGGDD